MQKVFWFHYNKPESLKRGYSVLTVHYNKTCHLVRGIRCSVPTFSYNRKTQPRLIIKGKCSKISILEGIAYID